MEKYTLTKEQIIEIFERWYADSRGSDDAGTALSATENFIDYAKQVLAG